MAKNANGRGTIYAEHDGGWRLTATVNGDRISEVHRSKRAATAALETRRSAGDEVTGERIAGVGRARWIGQYFDSEGRRRKVQGPSYADVEQRMRAKLDATRRGEPTGDGNATVAQAIQLWQDQVFNRRRRFVDMAPSTRNRYRWALDLLESEFGSRRLAKLTKRSIEAGFDRIATGVHGRCNSKGKPRPLGESSMRHIRLVLVSVLEEAQADRLIPGNPAGAAQVRASADDTDAQPRALRADEAARLFTACGEPWPAAFSTRHADALEQSRQLTRPRPWLGNMFRLMLATGVRPGEATALCWDAVDLQTGTIRISRSVQMTGTKPMLVERLKNASSKRTLRLSAAARVTLAEQRSALASASLPDDHNALVFPSHVGSLLNPSNVRAELASLARVANIPGRVTPHTLRHTCASHLVHSGVPLPQVARLLGHSTTRTLERHYVHAVVDIVEVGTDLIDDVFLNVVGAGAAEPGSGYGAIRMR